MLSGGWVWGERSLYELLGGIGVEDVGRESYILCINDFQGRVLNETVFSPNIGVRFSMDGKALKFDAWLWNIIYLLFIFWSIYGEERMI